MFRPSTFSIVAHDPAAHAWGVAVQSKFIAVGAVVPFAEAGAGAVATQSFANTRYGPLGLAMMRQSLSAEETLAALLAGDPGRERRQVGL
ncbi:MAG TPA: fimbrial assembly protein FimA, partial [Chloroflexi bacterium]|nr:fimbrial assembly protein FimA [Chloroflexota bacterium]